jgi:hypothetical protein
MTTVDAIPDLTGLDKATQLDVLRRRMATVPGGRRDHAPTDLPAVTASEPSAPTEVAAVADLAGEAEDSEPLSGAVRGKTLRTMPVPHCSPRCSHGEPWPAEAPSQSPVPGPCSSPSSPKHPPPATTSPSSANHA